jgi:murein DD-endopeptidase MepM/ murein hydrolase activator NlpD
MPFPRRLALALLLSFAAFPAAADPPAETLVAVARRGDTLAELLAKAGVDRAEAAAALAALAPRFPPRNLAIGQAIGIRLHPADNALLGLEVELAPGRMLTLRREGLGWLAEEHAEAAHPHLARIEAEITGGVFPTLVRAGLPPALAQDLVRALSHAVDFERDIQPGDSIAVAFERLRAADGELLRHGAVLHAALTLSGRVQDYWRHVDADGDAAWYEADGTPLQGGFLRTPLDGARLSSAFGMRRHPVLGFNRRHEGLDFAAPSGTPVFAASDGVVASARFESGYGRTVRLRHAGGVETVYAHLSRFAPGLRAGERVRQGETIGAVGASGLATGPHLHYEVRIADRAQDPARVALPAGQRLQGQALAEFHDRRRQLTRQIAQLASGVTEVALAGP